MDLDNIKIIKELGAGMLGTTYLVEINNKKYALKIQHILSSNRKKTFKSDLWREMDLYEFIEKLPPKDQQFFTKLYAFEIYNNCTHQQKRPWKVPDEGPFAERLRKLNSSPWCVKYLTDYHGNINLRQYLEKHTLTIKQTYSIMLQIIKILMILFKGGYSHNDLHTGNIMIKPTKEKYFEFQGHKIPFEGLQIIAIDYGEVLHNKFGINYKKDDWTKTFAEDREKHLYKEMFLWLSLVFDAESKLMEDCEKQKKKLPWERKGNIWDKGIKLLMKNHPEFYKNIIEKYSKIYPKSIKMLKYIFEHKNDKKTIYDMLKGKKDLDDFWSVFRILQLEFSYYYPEEFSKYFGWCSVRKINLPEKDFNAFIQCKNYKEIIKTCLNYI
jgi:serine/threonine protein kinase